MTKVSIITPTYNRLDLLKKTVLSVINQEFSDWEMIIVDDCSDKITQDYFEVLSKEDSRFNVYLKQVHLDVRGPQFSRNIGIEIAKGEYIIFLDSDDLLLPYCLKQRVEYMDTNENVEMAVFPGYKFWEKDCKKKLIGYCIEENVLPVERFFTDADLFMTINPIWRREDLINKSLKWDLNVKQLQDWDFHISAFCKGVIPMFVPHAKPDFYWVFHEEIGRISVNRGRYDIYISRLNLYLKWYNSLSQSNLLTIKVDKGLKNMFQTLSYQFLKLRMNEDAHKVLRMIGSLPSTTKLDYIKSNVLFQFYRLVVMMGLI